jgi:phospholipase C
MNRKLNALKTEFTSGVRPLLLCVALFAIAVACSGGHTSPVPGVGNGKASKPPGKHHPQGTVSGNIKYVIVLVQENRSYNELFNSIGGNTTTQAYDGSLLINLNQRNFYEPGCDPNHANVAWRQDAHWNGTIFQNDGFGTPTPTCTNGATAAPSPMSYSYVNQSSGSSNPIANYLYLANNWAISDMTFQMNMGPSFEAHQYLIAGQSGGFVSAQPSPGFGMVGNPADASKSGKGGIFTTGGCDTPFPNIYADGFDFSLDYLNPYPLDPLKPCYDYNTIFDVITGNPVAPTWKYYTPAEKDIWSAPIAVQHLYNADVGTNIHISSSEAQDFYSDVQNGDLANLTYLIPCTTWSDHPVVSGNGPPDGPNWVGFVVNTIAHSTYWPNSVIIVVWDDWGGWYDNHLGGFNSPNPYAANKLDPYEYGYRVPMLVISPFAVIGNGHVNSHPRTTAAILDFIEKTFSAVPGGEGALGTLDSTSAALYDDLMTGSYAMINPTANPTLSPVPSGALTQTAFDPASTLSTCTDARDITELGD